MSKKSNWTFKKADCPKCNNEAILKENDQSGTKTLICLNCGFYHTGPVSFFMHITDVNEMRQVHGLKPISKLIDVSKK